MPLNIFNAFSNGRGDGEGFFQRGFRRRHDSHGGHTAEDSRRYPSIRRQALTRGFRRHHEPEEVILPVPPPVSRRATVEDYQDSFDGESYIEVPRDLREPSVHYAPSMRGPVPAVHRNDLHDHLYEPSIHNFGTPPSVEEYSDLSSPVSSADPQYPMGGYSGRDMMHDPVHLNPPTIQLSDSEDSRDQYMEDGRKHPEFRRPPSQPIYSVPSSSGSHSTVSPGARGLSDHGSVTPPFRHDREREIEPDRYEHDRSRPRYEEPRYEEPRSKEPRYEEPRYEKPRSDAEYRTPDTFYIIPAGTNVIFQDEHGNEITRVGDFSGRRSRRPHREAPLIVQDEYGRELYRTPGYGGSRGGSSYGGSSDRTSYMDHYASSQGSIASRSSSNGPNVILLDPSGRQIPLSGSSGSMSGSGSYRGGGSSYRSGSTTSSSPRRYREVVNNGIRTIHI